MKYTVIPTHKFQKDVKLLQKRGYDMLKLTEVIKLLADGETLPERYKDHALIGNLVNHRECHIKPNWLLIYEIADDQLILTLTRTGTHSDLF